jgi:hypothetical protein
MVCDSFVLSVAYVAHLVSSSLFLYHSLFWVGNFPLIHIFIQADFRLLVGVKLRQSLVF